MNARIMIGRITWKEIRQQLPLFCMLLGLAIVLQLVAKFLLSWPGPSESVMQALYFGLLGGFSALFAATCGALLFVGEAEMGTARMMQVLPLQRRHFVTGKLLGGGALILAFLVVAISFMSVIWLVSLLSSDHPFYVPSDWGALLFSFSLPTLEFFCWGWLCSLLFKRTLVAAISGIFLASCSVSLLVAVYHYNTVYDAFALQPYQAVWPARLVIVAALIAINSHLSGKWLDRLEVRRPPRVSFSERTRLLRPSTASSFWRLCWQTVRQTRAALAVYALATIISTVVLILHFANGSSSFLAQIAFAILLLSPLCIGIQAFSGDQIQRRFRFFVQQGERPHVVWASRIFTPLLVVLPTLLCLSLIWHFCVSQSANVASIELSGRELAYMQVLLRLDWLYSLYTLGALAIGYWVSIVFQSRLLAGIAAAFMTSIYAAWLMLMILGQIPLWWAALPIPLGFLFSGWLRSPNWLQQRTSFVSWLAPTGIIVVVTSAVIWGVSYYRATEIPVVDLDLPKTEIESSILMEIGSHYSVAHRKYVENVRLFETNEEDMDTPNPIYDPRIWWGEDLLPPELATFVRENADCLADLQTAIDTGDQHFDQLRFVDRHRRAELARGGYSHHSPFGALLHCQSIYYLLVEPDIEKGLEAILMEMKFQRQTAPH